jgi:hypothetical protein
MTTLSLVGAGGAMPALPAAPASDPDAPAHHVGIDLGAGNNAELGGAHGGGDSLALLTAGHDLHPLAQQQQVAYFGNGINQAGAIKAPPHKVVPDAATRTYDVATTTQAEIDALKNSPNPQQQRLGHTIENAKVAYADLLDNNIKIAAALNAGNGGEPVLTITSEDFKYTQPTRVHTHYHGDNATVGDPVGSKAGQNSRIRETLARDPQMVFVLPECSNATPTADGPKNDNYYKADWGNVKSQAETTDLALRPPAPIP